MKKQIRKITPFILSMMIGNTLAGCATSIPAQTETTADTPALENIQNVLTAGDGNPVKTSLPTRTGSLELFPYDPAFHEEASGTDTRISIGSLEIILPLGWEAHTEITDEGSKQYILADIHSKYAETPADGEKIKAHKDGYEHDIVITPYQIKQMPDSLVQLTAEMKEYFPSPLLYTIKSIETTDKIKGCWIYGEDLHLSEEEYFLFSENESGVKELFHVQEGSPIITAYDNDVESFRDLIRNQMVRTDGGLYTVSQDNSIWEREYYFLLNPRTDRSLLVTARISPKELCVYRTGSYEAPLLVQDADYYPEYLAVADIDQDGYDDLLCNNWVLDPQYSPRPNDIEDLEGYLWNEENNTFTYVSGEQMLAQYGSFWENRQQEHEQGIQMIPEDLTAYLSKYILDSKEEIREAMLPLVSDQQPELDMERIKELAETNASIKKHMLLIASASDRAGIWLETDADNDGINDIFLCEYLGGSLGSVTYYLFKGTSDGNYILTDAHKSLKQEFGFLRWKGKNYLAKTTYNFEKKEVDGLSLECYEDGQYCGGVWIAITAKEGSSGRSIQTSYLKDAAYQSLKSALETLAAEYRSGSRLPHGTAEEENNERDYNRSCDINNDGSAEQYNISLWQTTNYYTTDYLSVIPENEDDLIAIYHMMTADDVIGICMNLWVDVTAYGNITYLLYEEGLYDFHIYGYLISGSEYQKLIQVDCHVQTEATVTELSCH